MSFLAGRSASKECSFFLQESKNAAARLAQRLPSSPPSASSPSVSSSSAAADVLPEVLPHSFPLKTDQPSSLSTLSSYSKWSLPNSSDSSSRHSLDAVNPVAAGYFRTENVGSFSSVYFPWLLGYHLCENCKLFNRWSLPNPDQPIPASTANELRRDKVTNIDPEKLSAIAHGISQIGKAFVVATIIVFGGATVTFAFAASKLDLQINDDIKAKVKSLLQPKFEGVKALKHTLLHLVHGLRMSQSRRLFKGLMVLTKSLSLRSFQKDLAGELQSK